MNSQKRRRSTTPDASSCSVGPDAGTTKINNREVVQNQAVNQTVHGAQFYGTVYNRYDTSASKPDHEAAKLNDGLLASLAFPGMLDRRDNIAQPHGKTCNWIFKLEQYRNWTAKSRGLLWIKGKPGSGKSTLMSFLHRSLRRERQTGNVIHLDFFFHARGSELQHTPMGMLRSILNQLLRGCPDVTLDATTSYRDKCTAYGNGPRSWEWQKSELERLLADALITACSYRPVILFIDALDEAGSDSARAIAAYFHTINDRAAIADNCNEHNGLKICMSSRHYPIVSRIQGVEICMEAHNTKDIEVFIRDEIRNAMEIADDPSSGDLWKEIADEVLEHAQGVFQWVRLALNILFDEFEQGLPMGNTKALLRRLPQDLGDIYEYILQTLKTPPNRNYVAESLLLFQWVCLAEWPLTPIELMYAIASATKDQAVRLLRPEADKLTIERRIKSLSGGLVEVIHTGPKDTMIVQVIHQTVREYLIERGLRLLFVYHAENCTQLQSNSKCDKVALIQQCQSTLYWCCLSYIEMFDEEGLIARLGESHQGEGLRLRGAQGQILSFPFLEYAVLRMFIHARKAATHRTINSILNTTDKPEFRRLESIRPFWNMVHDELRHNTNSNWSLLHIAAFFDADNLTRCLIDNGHSPNQFSLDSVTPLHLAARKGHLDTSRLLLSAGANVNITASDAPYETEQTILHEAIHGDDYATVKLILDAGAHIDAQGKHGNTALMLAVEAVGVQECIVKILLDAGADVNARDEHGKTALMLASEYWDGCVVQILLDAGADVNAQDKHGKTALMLAVDNECESIVQILLDAGADVNVQDEHGKTILMSAAEVFYYCESIVQILLNAGANINAHDAAHNTALLVAVYCGNERIVQVLLDAGANIHARNVMHDTALQLAARCHSVYHHQKDCSLGSRYHNTAHRAVDSWRYRLWDDPNAYVKIEQRLLDAGATDNDSIAIESSTRTRIQYSTNSPQLMLSEPPGLDATLQNIEITPEQWL